MDLLAVIVFCLAVVAIVALGRPVRGRLDRSGIEISSRSEKGKKNV